MPIVDLRQFAEPRVVAGGLIGMAAASTRPECRTGGSRLFLWLALGAAGCSGGDGLSTAEAQEAAKARVRQELGLTREAALFTNVFVGREREDEPVVCGTVAGRNAAGSSIAPRRFIAGTDPSRFLSLEPVASATHATPTDKFAEWAELCAGAEGETGGEPLVPTEVGEQ